MSGQNIEDSSIGWRSLNWDMPETRTLKFNGNLLNNNSGANILGYLWTKYSDSKFISAWSKLFMTCNRIKLVLLYHFAADDCSRTDVTYFLTYQKWTNNLKYQILSYIEHTKLMQHWEPSMYHYFVLLKKHFIAIKPLNYLFLFVTN